MLPVITSTLVTWGAGTLTGAQQKDVNAMLVATPSSGTVTYIWYADNDAGTEAMPAQTYSYYLEGSSKKENHENTNRQ